MTKFGISIGINNYPGTGSDLAGCINDARDWQAALRRRGFRTGILLDGRATRSRITRALAAVLRAARGGDLVVITYSGHGTWVPDRDGDETDGRDEAWCPADLGTAGVLLDDELARIFAAAAPGVRIVVISDSCHSGTVVRSLVPSTAAQRVRFLPPTVAGCQLPAAQRVASYFRPRPRAIGSALLLSGCQDWEYSYDAQFQNRPNGAFTYVALRALVALPPLATYADWLQAIRRQLPSQSYPQTPNLLGTQDQIFWRVLQ